MHDFNFVNNHFSVDITVKDNITNLTFRSLNGITNTKTIPQTLKILETRVPKVLKTRCFNEGNLPFAEEVVETEIGHLFEHILLERLCKYKADMCQELAKFSGETVWDWNKDERGTFHITVNACCEDLEYLKPALEDAIEITYELMESVDVEVDVRS